MFSPRKTILCNQDKTWTLDQCELKDPDGWFDKCSGLAWLHKPEFTGTTFRANRNIGVYSDVVEGYHVSKRSNAFVQARPLTSDLKLLLAETNKYFGEDYNLIVVNEYENHLNSIGPHFDDKSGLGRHGTVAISLGAERIFQLNSQESKVCKPILFPLPHGNVMFFCNTFQSMFLHSVPRSETPCGKRISLTFRSIHGIIHHIPKIWRPHDPSECRFHSVCKGMTYHWHRVCDACFAENKFLCPTCQCKVGAPWPCSECYLKSKLLNVK